MKKDAHPYDRKNIESPSKLWYCEPGCKYDPYAYPDGQHAHTKKGCGYYRFNPWLSK